MLVTGGAGFIGSHTVDELLRSGYRVRVLDSLQERVHPRGLPGYLSPEADFVNGDVTDRDAVRGALHGVSHVIHLAAHQDYMPEFSKFITTNAGSLALLFEVLVAEPTLFRVEKIVFASSQSVSGEGKYWCPIEEKVFYPGPRSIAQLRRAEWDIRCDRCGTLAVPQLIDEATSNPHTAYGISKYASELLAFRLGSRYGIATAGMRYTYVQGSRNSFYNAYSGIARRFALRIRAGLPPVCYEDGQQQRDYVNVADAARANLMVLESKDADGLAYNVGGGRVVTVLEFARLMLEVAGSDLVPEVPGQFRVGDTRHTVSDISRMSALGWKPLVPVEQNAIEYLQWLDTQTGTAEYLFEAERIMAESGVVQEVGS